MKESFELKETFPVKPSVIYKAWLDSEQHSQMTGGEANCTNEVGGTFSAWDGYIQGTNIELVSDKEIVQTWRTTQFEENDEDSKLTLRLAEINGGCEVTLIHSEVPEEQMHVKQGWKDHYFIPMKRFFEDKV